MSSVPFFCANVTRHFRSHDRLVYIVTPWAQSEHTSSPGAYFTFNAVDKHVRASVGESAEQAFAAIWSLREVKSAQPVCGMEPLIEQLLWLCLGWCHGGHQSRTKAAVHCLLDVLREVERLPTSSTAACGNTTRSATSEVMRGAWRACISHRCSVSPFNKTLSPSFSPCLCLRAPVASRLGHSLPS